MELEVRTQSPFCHPSATSLPPLCHLSATSLPPLCHPCLCPRTQSFTRVIYLSATCLPLLSLPPDYSLCQLPLCLCPHG
jgi:hypothetical protein